MVRVILVLVAVAVLGCASKKVSLDEPEKFEKNLNASTTDQNEKIGVRDSKIIIQKRLYLEEELAKIQGEIRDLENSIYGKSKRDTGGIFVGLQECRKRIADPRLGGNGKPEPMEKWEKISEKDTDFNYAVDDKNNIVAVAEEDLETRIVNLRKTKRLINDRYDDFRDKLDSCESRYQTALVQHGLDPKDTEAVGEWVEGPNGYRVWKMRKPATKDPEELMRRKQQREGRAGE